MCLEDRMRDQERSSRWQTAGNLGKFPRHVITLRDRKEAATVVTLSKEVTLLLLKG